MYVPLHGGRRAGVPGAHLTSGALSFLGRFHGLLTGQDLIGAVR
jgi:hypothetical protein